MNPTDVPTGCGEGMLLSSLTDMAADAAATLRIATTIDFIKLGKWSG
jgi:hypothetical protein